MMDIKDCYSTFPDERIRDAAPQLLEALEEITDVYCKRLSGGGWNPDLDPDVIKSRAAIAAAKGE